MIAAVAIASTAFTLADSSPSTPSVEMLAFRSSHQVTITHSQGSASIVLTPLRGRRAPWRGDVVEGAVYASGRWTTFTFDKTGGGYRATARIAEFGDVDAFAVLTESGASYTWVEEDRPVQANGDADNGDKPKDPDPEEPEPEDPPEDGGLCDGIVDPWTGECDSEIRDPWEDEETDGQTVQFTI